MVVLVGVVVLVGATAALVFGLSGPLSPSRPAVPRSALTSSTTTPPPSTTIAPATSTTTTLPTTTSAPPTSTTTTTIPSVATIPPSDVLVEVLNGVGTRHAALQAARALKARGFLINGTGNANRFDYAKNVIEYPPGSFVSAETVAHYVSGAARFKRTASLQSNEVWVILGATYDGVIN